MTTGRINQVAIVGQLTDPLVCFAARPFTAPREAVIGKAERTNKGSPQALNVPGMGREPYKEDPATQQTEPRLFSLATTEKDSFPNRVLATGTMWLPSDPHRPSSMHACA